MNNFKPTDEELKQIYPSMQNMKPAYRAKARIDDLKQQGLSHKEYENAIKVLKTEFEMAREAVFKAGLTLIKERRSRLASIERMANQYSNQIMLIENELTRIRDIKHPKKELSEKSISMHHKKAVEPVTVFILISTSQFQYYLEQLSLAENGFVNPVSAKNADIIYRNIEKNVKNCPYNAKNRIDFPLTASWGIYKKFFEYSTTIQTEKGGSIIKVPTSLGGEYFFKRYCLFKGEHKTQDQVHNGCKHIKRIENNEKVKTRIIRIIENTLNYQSH